MRQNLLRFLKFFGIDLKGLMNVFKLRRVNRGFGINAVIHVLLQFGNQQLGIVNMLANRRAELEA